MERDVAVKFLLQALQLWTICEAIFEHGDGYCHGKGKASSYCSA